MHSMAKDTTQSLLKTLLGTQLWGGWFWKPDIVIEDGCILPRQMMAFLYYALQQLKDHYEAVEETKSAAAKSYAVLLEASSKKKRTAT